MTPLSQYVFTLDGIAIAVAVEFRMPPYPTGVIVMASPRNHMPWIIKYIHGPVGSPYANRPSVYLPDDYIMGCFNRDGYAYIWVGETPPDLTVDFVCKAAHEAVHATAGIFLGLGHEDMLSETNQEPFAYLLQAVTHAILTAFTENHSAPLHYVPLVPGDPGVYFDATSPLHSEAVALKTRASMPLRDSAS